MSQGLRQFGESLIVVSDFTSQKLCGSKPIGFAVSNCRRAIARTGGQVVTTPATLQLTDAEEGCVVGLLFEAAQDAEVLAPGGGGDECGNPRRTFREWSNTVFNPLTPCMSLGLAVGVAPVRPATTCGASLKKVSTRNVVVSTSSQHPPPALLTAVFRLGYWGRENEWATTAVAG